jgi:hypothetical protein
MGKQLARHWSRGQESRIAAGAPLNYEFAMYRFNPDGKCPNWSKGAAGAVAVAFKIAAD